MIVILIDTFFLITWKQFVHSIHIKLHDHHLEPLHYHCFQLFLTRKPFVSWKLFQFWKEVVWWHQTGGIGRMWENRPTKCQIFFHGCINRCGVELSRCRITPKLKRPGCFSLIFFWDPPNLPCIFWNLFRLYSHFLGNRWTVCFDSPKRKCRKIFLSNGQDKFFWYWLTFFRPNLSVFFLCQCDVKNPQLGMAVIWRYIGNSDLLHLIYWYIYINI